MMTTYKMPDLKTQKITQSTGRFLHNILHLMVDVGQEIFAFLSRQQEIGSMISELELV